jgi:hypothetical protein
MSLLIAAVATPPAVAQPAEEENDTAAQPASGPSAVRAGSGPLKLSWDTTVKYSAMFRVAKPANVLTNPALNANQDDGDNNFHRGLVSNRLDILSEMDVSFGRNFGIRASTAAWFDPVYNQKTDYRSVTYNGDDPRHFLPGTKDLQFLQAELLDAFAHVKVPLRNSTLTLRGGQFGQVWGQTVFFGGNGIAGAMAPIDVIKLLSVPNSQFKEIIRPVPQLSAVLQINPKVSVGAYYQFMWEETRIPSVGSYFSTGDMAGPGANRFFFGAPVVTPFGPLFNPANGQLVIPYLTKVRNVEPKDWGQFGVELLVAAPRGWDLGFYAVQFHNKAFQLYGAAGPLLDPLHFNPLIAQIGSYTQAYQENIKVLGMSATKTTGIVNWAGEVSGRINQDLTGALPIVVAPPNAWAINKNALYPVGNTLHVNLSALATLRPNFIARESSLLAEVAWNHLLSVTKNGGFWNMPVAAAQAAGAGCFTLTSGTCNSATRSAMAFMVLYTPTYRQILPGVELSIPVGFNFSPYGRSVLGPSFNTHHGGFFNIGASVAYRDATRLSLTYQRFIGEQGGFADANNLFSYKQAQGDRNYIALSIYRTFGVRASQKK